MAREIQGTAAHSDGRRIFPLSKLAESISLQLERSFPGNYWITAELSKLNYYPHSGHCYPQLVEKKDGVITAEIKGFIPGGRYRDISARFAKATGKNLEDGMQILILCKVSYHALYGLSVNIIDLEPSYTLGEMARMRLEALNRLKSEGIIAVNKGLHLPILLKRFAVVSVETSKGLRDFNSILDASPWRESILIRLYPALLQGDAAIQSIRNALDEIRMDSSSFDCVVIIRGGGGETGLDCYDSYLLAREVCLFPLPVLTGIGHATNLTLVEQVAHRNLITPTDLARFVTDGFDSFAERLEKAGDSLRKISEVYLPLRIQSISLTARKLEGVVSRRHTSERELLSQHGHNLRQLAKTAIEAASAQLTYRYPSTISERVRRKLTAEQSLAEKSEQRLLSSQASLLRHKLTALGHAEEKLKLLDPVHILHRGYSITSLNGRAITNPAELAEGDVITTTFAEGSAQSTINSTSNEQ